MEQILNIVKRSLVSLDYLENQGVAVGLLRAELSTAADRLEKEIKASGDDGRPKCEKCGGRFSGGDMAATVMVRDPGGETRQGYICMACLQESVNSLQRDVEAMVDKFGLKAMMVRARLQREVH